MNVVYRLHFFVGMELDLSLTLLKMYKVYDTNKEKL